MTDNNEIIQFIDENLSSGLLKKSVETKEITG
jgi:hypothetical protein